MNFSTSFGDVIRSGSAPFKQSIVNGMQPGHVRVSERERESQRHRETETERQRSCPWAMVESNSLNGQLEELE